MKKWWALLLMFTYWGVIYFLDGKVSNVLISEKTQGIRTDIIIMGLVPTLLYYGGKRTRPLLQFLLPLFLTLIVYDSQRYYADLIRGPIHVKEPYDFDKYFFGIKTAAGVLTPNEWWQIHTVGILDFICGIAYIIFVPVYVAVAAYFRFWLPKKGTKICHPESVGYRAPQIMWAFFWVNVIGYSTYYWYAASPPWYTALYGFGPARLDVAANLAGCARFDQFVGMPIFANWYGRSADVHGAIPSLHIAYPLISVYWAFRFGSLRVFTTAYYILMCFSAVYLNHHYVLDILWGSAYAIIVAVCLDGYWNEKLKKAGVIVPGAVPVPSSKA